jgi:hypothetical protein
MAILDPYKNLALAIVATAPSPATSGTTLTLTAGQGAYLPTPPFNATAFDVKVYPTPANAEIVRVTAKAGDVLTIVRAQEGTTARAIVAGDAIAATFTTKFVTDLADAQNLTAGTLPDARLSANVPLKNASNVFTATPQEIGTATPELRWRDTSAPAGSRLFRWVNYAQLFEAHALDDTAATVLATPLSLRRSGDVVIGQNLYEKGRTTPIGHWTDVPFSAANFTASAGTWTIGTVITNRYTLIGKTLVYVLAVQICTISATPGTLTMALPPGLTTPTLVTSAMAYTNGASGSGLVYCDGGGSVLHFARDLGFTPWVADSASIIYASITVPVV